MLVENYERIFTNWRIHIKFDKKNTEVKNIKANIKER